MQDAHAAELAALEERIEAYGERGSNRKALADEQKRRLRRHRTGELRFGLAALAARYRDSLAAGEAGAGAVAAVDAAADALTRNPNEALLLQALLLALQPLP